MVYPFDAQRPKMVRYTLKILQQVLQDFLSVLDHFGTLYIKGLREKMKYLLYNITKVSYQNLEIFWCNGFTKELLTLQCNTSFNTLFPSRFLQWPQIAALVCLLHEIICMLQCTVT